MTRTGTRVNVKTALHCLTTDAGCVHPFYDGKLTNSNIKSDEFSAGNKKLDPFSLRYFQISVIRASLDGISYSAGRSIHVFLGVGYSSTAKQVTLVTSLVRHNTSPQVVFPAAHSLPLCACLCTCVSVSLSLYVHLCLCLSVCVSTCLRALNDYAVVVFGGYIYARNRGPVTETQSHHLRGRSVYGHFLLDMFPPENSLCGRFSLHFLPAVLSGC